MMTKFLIGGVTTRLVKDLNAIVVFLFCSMLLLYDLCINY